ncbi:MAG TPA: hypothetical protein VKG78_05175, partial [Opitutaceae bacterium]|nr:hypothetical protein [Opitutaceae bacterium]
MSLAAAALAALAPLEAANLDGSPADVGNAEAARLYAEANAYVSNMAEGQYSYAYLQFYWKRAQSNVDRARRVYPDSPTARALGRGELKLGPYDLDYFRDRVLYNLELKRLGAYDDVNCAIFLYGLDPNRNDALRDEALSDILEVLARRQRWEEALRFPVLGVHRPLLLRSIFRIAAFYDQPATVKKLTDGSAPAERQAAGFDPIQAEAMALLGKPRAGLYRFVDEHPGREVRIAALRGIVERAALIRRIEMRSIPQGESIQTVHLVVQNLSLRDDVPAAAARLFKDSPDGAAPLLAVHSASLGASPGPGSPIEARLAYLRFLADAGRMDEVGSYDRGYDLDRETMRACQLKAIELYAEAGQMEKAEKIRKEFAGRGAADANDAGLAEFRGRMDSTEVPLVAREKTFSDLPIADPCVLATAIMDWSLTPNRSQRGATPWDAVIFKVAG